MSEFIAEAQVLIVPNTAQFATSLKAQVEAAVAAAGPIAIPVVAAPAATGAKTALAAETAAATTAVQAENVALTENAAALQKSGVAGITDAAAQAKITKAHEQATRAIEAQAASLAGVRGAVLTASTPFLLATAGAIALAKSLKEASDRTEEINKSFQVFGDSARAIDEFAKSTASSLGISEVEALKATGIFGNLFRTIQISTPTAADMSEQLVRLASDLASFNNADPSRVLEALRSGLVGQARPLRVFGIFISQARAQQEALIETGKRSTKELTNAELVQARYNIILKDSSIAQGDFARTSDRLANQSRILKANLADAAGTIGGVLVPALSAAARNANDYLGAIKRAADATNEFAKSVHVAAGGGGQGSFLSNAFHTATRNFVDDAREINAARILLSQGKPIKFGEAATETLRNLNREAERARESLPALRSDIADLFKAFQQSGGRESASAVNEFVLGLQHLQEEQKKGLITSDEFARRIANLIKQLQDPEAFNINVTAALDETGLRESATRGANLVVSTLRDVLSPQTAHALGFDFMQNLGVGANDAAPAAGSTAGKTFVLNLSSQVAVAQATGSDAQQLSVLRARLAKRKAFLASLLTGDRDVAQSLIQRAAANVEADENAIQAILDKQAAAEEQTARVAQENSQRIQAAAAARKKAIQDAARAQKEADAAQAQALAERKKAIIDRRQAHLEALLAIAETTASARDDRAAEKALIKFDQVQIRRILAIKRRRRLTIDEANELDAYRVDLAQRNAALKGVQKTAEDTNKKMKDLAFTFLQTQQGFAANLLGNLIPGFATAGLVGNAAPSSSGDGLRQVAGGFEQPRGAVESNAALASSRDRGVRPVQVDTTNQLLRQILAALRGRPNPPEITHNRQRANAAYDTLGAMGD